MAFATDLLIYRSIDRNVSANHASGHLAGHLVRYLVETRPDPTPLAHDPSGRHRQAEPCDSSSSTGRPTSGDRSFIASTSTRIASSSPICDDTL